MVDSDGPERNRLFTIEGLLLHQADVVDVLPVRQERHGHNPQASGLVQVGDSPGGLAQANRANVELLDFVDRP